MNLREITAFFYDAHKADPLRSSENLHKKRSRPRTFFETEFPVIQKIHNTLSVTWKFSSGTDSPLRLSAETHRSNKSMYGEAIYLKSLHDLFRGERRHCQILFPWKLSRFL